MEGTEKAVEVAKDIGTEVVNQTKYMFHLDDITKYFTWSNLFKLATSLLAIIIFYIVYRVIRHLLKKKVVIKMQPNNAHMLLRIVSYTFYIIIGMYILSLFGIDLKGIWGAAGVAGLALGFAAQTTVSNFISGLFVVSEKTLKIGDFIEAGGVCGTVDTIGMLSLKIHTLDNQMVRIPNSTIIDTNLINYSQYSIRRTVFTVPISYSTDLDHAYQVLSKVPSLCPTVIAEPAPLLWYDGFDTVANAVNLKVAVWFNSSDLLKNRTEVYTAIMKLCKENNVTIPFTSYNIKITGDKQDFSGQS